MSWHKLAETRVVSPIIISRLRWPIEPKFSQVCYFIYKLWYTKCEPLDNTVYRKCPMALKKTKGFKGYESLTSQNCCFIEKQAIIVYYFVILSIWGDTLPGGLLVVIQCNNLIISQRWRHFQTGNISPEVLHLYYCNMTPSELFQH